MQASAVSENAFKQSLSAAANQSLVDAMRKDIGAKADAAAITSAGTNARMVMDTFQLSAAELETRRGKRGRFTRYTNRLEDGGKSSNAT